MIVSVNCYYETNFINILISQEIFVPYMCINDYVLNFTSPKSSLLLIESILVIMYAEIWP